MLNDKLAEILSQKDYSKACKKLIKYTHRVIEKREDDKTFLDQFSDILAAIFGIARPTGWMDEAHSNTELYEDIVALLKPEGDLFTFMFTHLQIPYVLPKSKLNVCYIEIVF